MFLLIQVRALQQPTPSSEQQEKKKIPLGHELFLFSWLSPLAKLTEFSSQRYPPNPFPPPNSLPHPQMSLQLSYKQINFSKF